MNTENQSPEVLTDATTPIAAPTPTPTPRPDFPDTHEPDTAAAHIPTADPVTEIPKQEAHPDRFSPEEAATFAPNVVEKKNM